MCRGLLERVPRGGSGREVTEKALPLLSLPPDPAPFLGSLGWAACDGKTWALGGRAGKGPWLSFTRCSFFLSTVTPSDYYVTLWLPTACGHRLQTRTVKNSRNPVWNQSFRFRIHSQLKVGLASARPFSLPLSTAPVPSQPFIPFPSHLPILPLLPAAPPSVPLPECPAAASLRPGPSDQR